jgi:hypothetical protein
MTCKGGARLAGARDASSAVALKLDWGSGPGICGSGGSGAMIESRTCGDPVNTKGKRYRRRGGGGCVLLCALVVRRDAAVKTTKGCRDADHERRESDAKTYRVACFGVLVYRDHELARVFLLASGRHGREVQVQVQVQVLR